jgi:hypothetical protein
VHGLRLTYLEIMFQTGSVSLGDAFYASYQGLNRLFLPFRPYERSSFLKQ